MMKFINLLLLCQRWKMQFLEFKDKDLRQITLSTASLHRVYKLQLAEYERNSDLYLVVFTAL